MKAIWFSGFGIFIVMKNPLGMIMMLLWSLLALKALWDLVENSRLAKFGNRRWSLSLIRFRPKPQLRKDAL